MVTVNGLQLEQEQFNLTDDELLRLRALLKTQMLAPTFWHRAFAVLGYTMAANVIVVGLICFVAFLAGVARGFGL